MKLSWAPSSKTVKMEMVKRGRVKRGKRYVDKKLTKWQTVLYLSCIHDRTHVRIPKVSKKSANIKWSLRWTWTWDLMSENRVLFICSIMCSMYTVRTTNRRINRFGMRVMFFLFECEWRIEDEHLKEPVYSWWTNKS